MIVQTPTREELQAELDEIEATYPALKALDPSAFCCHGCAYTAVGREHGWEAADAFERLLDLNYLLIGRRP
ncbi:hypothetical protein AB4Y81_03245 [Paenarthrobacter sp. TAF1]|uniref:hypothetical protein n=1 Tax=Paenarthrobacter sp. TAF1 TaxID=3233067 RepID=UPI003F95CE09